MIDYGRCGNCLECLNFCVFGAFGLDESRQVFVEQPDACKYGCPACSRVCPSRAIMFPQYPDPLMAGEVLPLVGDFKVDLMPLLGAADPRELAAAERDRALAEQAASQPPPGDAAANKDDLDRLVDGLDESEL